MSSSAMQAVQRGLYGTLTNDATLMALLDGGSGVLDRVPGNPSYPMVVIGETVEMPDRTMGQGGHDVLADVTIYTRDGSTDARGTGSVGFKQGLVIMERIHELVVGTPAGVRTLTVVGFDLIDADVDGSQTQREPDGITRMVDVRYRLMLETQP